MNEISNYAACLPAEVKKRYFEKISPYKFDPFYQFLFHISSKSFSFQDFDTGGGFVQKFPKVSFFCIKTYFVEGVSFYTKNQFRSYKSLEAYNFSISGHVKLIRWKAVGSSFIVIAVVKPSYRINDPGHHVWVVFSEFGEIITCHCTCIAGAAETCSHAGAVCFWVQYVTNNTSVTDLPAYWMKPKGNHLEKAVPIDSLNFVSAKRIQNSLMNGKPLPCIKKILPVGTGVKKDDENVIKKRCLEKIPNSVLHRCVPPFSISMNENLKKQSHEKLALLFDNKYEGCTVQKLTEVGKTINFNLNNETRERIQEMTKTQSQCKDWFAYRAGRITASNARAVCKVKAPDSSISLITKICYPAPTKVVIKAMQWGCDHEDDAAKMYEELMKQSHQSFEMEKCGLFIHDQYPYFAATPDRLVFCECCGAGIIEVKCPHTLLKNSIDTYKHLELKNNELSLKTTSAYYYQIQVQLLCTKSLYCDFIVWTPNPNVRHIQRIYIDEELITEIIRQGTLFFYNVILPELLGRYYTRMKVLGKENVI